MSWKNVVELSERELFNPKWDYAIGYEVKDGTKKFWAVDSQIETFQTYFQALDAVHKLNKLPAMIPSDAKTNWDVYKITKKPDS